MYIFALIVLSFLLTCLFKYMDDRSTPLEVLFDWESLIVGMLFSAVVIYVAYLLLRIIFRGLGAPN
jgi:hypothetical protein